MASRTRTAHVIGEAKLRAMWEDMFSESASSMQSRLSRLRRVEGEFEKYVGILNGDRQASGVEPVSELHGHLVRLARDTPFANPRAFPVNLDELPRDAIIIPVMVSGLPFAAATAGMLRRLGKEPAVVFVRYSKNKARQMGRKLPADDGLVEVDVPRGHAEFLAGNSGRAAVVVDGWILTGQTFGVVERFLAALGFGEIHMVHYSNWIRLSSALDGSGYTSGGMFDGKHADIVVNTMDKRHVPLSELVLAFTGERL